MVLEVIAGSTIGSRLANAFTLSSQAKSIFGAKMQSMLDHVNRLYAPLVGTKIRHEGIFNSNERDLLDGLVSDKNEALESMKNMGLDKDSLEMAAAVMDDLTIAMVKVDNWVGKGKIVDTILANNPQLTEEDRIALNKGMFRKFDQLKLNSVPGFKNDALSGLQPSPAQFVAVEYAAGNMGNIFLDLAPLTELQDLAQGMNAVVAGWVSIFGLEKAYNEMSTVISYYNPVDDQHEKSNALHLPQFKKLNKRQKGLVAFLTTEQVPESVAMYGPATLLVSSGVGSVYMNKTLFYSTCYREILDKASEYLYDAFYKEVSVLSIDISNCAEKDLPRLVNEITIGEKTYEKGTYINQNVLNDLKNSEVSKIVIDDSGRVKLPIYQNKMVNGRVTDDIENVTARDHFEKEFGVKAAGLEGKTKAMVIDVVNQAAIHKHAGNTASREHGGIIGALRKTAHFLMRARIDIHSKMNAFSDVVVGQESDPKKSLMSEFEFKNPHSVVTHATIAAGLKEGKNAIGILGAMGKCFRLTGFTSDIYTRLRIDNNNKADFVENGGQHKASDGYRSILHPNGLEVYSSDIARNIVDNLEQTASVPLTEHLTSSWKTAGEMATNGFLFPKGGLNVIQSVRKKDFIAPNVRDSLRGDLGFVTTESLSTLQKLARGAQTALYGVIFNSSVVGKYVGGLVGYKRTGWTIGAALDAAKIGYGTLTFGSTLLGSSTAGFMGSAAAAGQTVGVGYSFIPSAGSLVLSGLKGAAWAVMNPLTAISAAWTGLNAVSTAFFGLGAGVDALKTFQPDDGDKNKFKIALQATDLQTVVMDRDTNFVLPYTKGYPDTFLLNNAKGAVAKMSGVVITLPNGTVLTTSGEGKDIVAIDMPSDELLVVEPGGSKKKGGTHKAETNSMTKLDGGITVYRGDLNDRMVKVIESEVDDNFGWRGENQTAQQISKGSTIILSVDLGNNEFKKISFSVDDSKSLSLPKADSCVVLKSNAGNLIIYGLKHNSKIKIGDKFFKVSELMGKTQAADTRIIMNDRIQSSYKSRQEIRMENREGGVQSWSSQLKNRIREINLRDMNGGSPVMG